MKIPFNKVMPLNSSNLNENWGIAKQSCNTLLEDKFNFKSIFYTNSCTSALLTILLSIDLNNEAEIILPAYQYFGIANAIKLIYPKNKLVFVDSCGDNINPSFEQYQAKISDKTKLVVCLHYGGNAKDTALLAKYCKANNIILIEDAAHAIGAFYKQQALGTFGDFSIFSFHSTKNITTGQGGMLVVNNNYYYECILKTYNRGTNRHLISTDKFLFYQPIQISCSFELSELLYSCLHEQIKLIDTITASRRNSCLFYEHHIKEKLLELGFYFPKISFEESSCHIYYLYAKDNAQRNAFIDVMNQYNIQVFFHYQSLTHFSLYNENQQITQNASIASETLLRLPLYNFMQQDELDYIGAVIQKIKL